MAYVVNTYQDPICKNVQFQMVIGLAGITGTTAAESEWTKYNITSRNCAVYFKALNTQAILSDVTLSGGSTLFNFDDDTESKIDNFFNNPFSTDTISNGSQNACNNVCFIGTQGTVANYVRFYRGGLARQIRLEIGAYHQTPESESFDSRTAWNYQFTQPPDGFSPITGDCFFQFANNTKYGCVRPYKLTIWEKEFIMLVGGVDFAGGKPPMQSLSYPPTAILIPLELFQDQPNRPYVGPVSKESAESAYIGGRSKSDVKPRTLTNKNMLGFNADGVYLCKVTESQYRHIVAQIYRGLSGNILNAAGQVISGTIGGNDHRPFDEIQTMLQGVICCHAVPNANRFPVSGTVDMTTLCGYSMFNTFPLNTIDRFEQWNIQSGIIPRPTGCFLDFAPYTTVTLSIPILGNIDIDPSAILGKSLNLYFTLDAFSGSLACDICIIENNGTEWIYSTLQGNCAVSMPLVGAGAETNPLLKIAGGVSSLFTGGAQNVPNAIMSVYDGIQGASYSRPISRVQSSNVLPVISPTAIYLTVTTPNNYNAGDYWTLAGIPSHMSGTVGNFSGFTVFEHVDLSGVSGATESELQEIESILKGGVWL